MARTQESRTSLILNSSIPLQFDPSKVEQDLIKLLKTKSSKFRMGNHEADFKHEEGIFFLSGPIGTEKAIKKCPSCQYVFSNRGEMVYCTFCGNSNDEKCMRKTRIYPN